MTKITAIIPTLNEEVNVAKALASVAFADEVIVIDSYSTDKTVEIAESFGAKIIKREFDNFSAQKNYAMQQASHDWIFLLDADEVANEKLQKEIIERAKDPKGFEGFYIYRRFYFKGKNLKYSGWRHDKVIRLFNRRTCKYEGKVHEKIVSTGKIGFLKRKIHHYSLREIEKYRQKLDFYASLQAEELYDVGRVVTPYHLIIKPLARFFIQYFVKLGFLDGSYGFSICKMHANGVFLRYWKLLKLKKRKRKETKESKVFQFKNSTSSKKISVVIVNYKSWYDIETCLKSLTKVSSFGKELEVIVVDNCSNDGKLETFKNNFPQVDFLLNSGNNGFANGCNFGAKHAKGKYLLFLNPDTEISEETLERVHKYAIEHPEVGIVSCLQKNLDNSYENVVRFFPKLTTLFGVFRAIYKLVYYKSLNQQYNQIENMSSPDWISGSMVFMSRDWFLNINGWNEDYWMYFEDVDLSKKVRNYNGRIVLLEDTEIIHNHGGASRINVKTASLTKTEVMISRHVYLSNHLEGFHKFLALFLLVLNNLVFRSLYGVLGLVFFFIPRMKLQVAITGKLFDYYYKSLFNRTWLSIRSMNYH